MPRQQVTSDPSPPALKPEFAVSSSPGHGALLEQLGRQSSLGVGAEPREPSVHLGSWFLPWRGALLGFLLIACPFSLHRPHFPNLEAHLFLKTTLGLETGPVAGGTTTEEGIAL